MIKNPDAFYRALPAKFDGVFVWDYITDFLPRGIELSDIDAHVEIGGLHLFFETKDKGVKPETGERLKFRSLLDRPENSVLFIVGKKQEEVSYVEYYSGLGAPLIVNPAGYQDVQRLVAKWVEHAEWQYERIKQEDRERRRPHPDKWRFNFWE